MRPGITVQHASLPRRRAGLVRCDVTGLIAFIPPDRWPDQASAGDFLELRLERAAQFWQHPLRGLFSRISARSVGAFFENGGQVLHVFGVCLAGSEDLQGDSSLDGPLAPLLDRLRVQEEIAILVVPDAAQLPCHKNRKGEVRCEAEPLWDTLLVHCREMGNRFLILDAPRGLHGEPLVKLADSLAGRFPENRSYGALYYPWLYRREQHFPPSGSVAGVYARTERKHDPYGVIWPPANVQVRAATHVEVDLDWEETGHLAERSVNPLVVQPGRGVVVWGARTLCRKAPWEYINSRRVVSMVAEQLRRDNEWAVFETNDHRIWSVLKRDVGVRLEEFWRAGMLTGESSGGDYEVRCDHETNPLSEREDGKLNVQVQLRPIGMTEHITIDLRLGETPS